MFLPKQWKHYTKHTEVLLLLLLDMLLVRSANPPTLCQHPAPRTRFRTCPQETVNSDLPPLFPEPSPPGTVPRSPACRGSPTRPLVFTLKLLCCQKTFMRNFNQNTSFYSFVRTQPRDVKCRGETGKGLPGGLEGSVLEFCHRPCAQHLTFLGFGVFFSQREVCLGCEDTCPACVGNQVTTPRAPRGLPPLS